MTPIRRQPTKQERAVIDRWMTLGLPADVDECVARLKLSRDPDIPTPASLDSVTLERLLLHLLERVEALEGRSK
jgi:hypothetical protein